MITDSINTLKGVGPEREKAFNRIGIFTIRDLLAYYPRTYQDRSVIKKVCELTDGETVCIRAYPVTSLSSVRLRGGRSVQHLMVSDGTGRINVVWFNQKYMAGKFDLTTEYVFYGKISVRQGKTEMTSPTFERADSGKYTGKIVPIYSLTDGLTQKMMQSAIQMCIGCADEIEESLPDCLAERYNLCGINDAVRAIHFPDDFDRFNRARRRLVFEELLMLQLNIRSIKKKKSEISCEPYTQYGGTEEFIASLPYELTNAQKRTIEEIRCDLSSTVPMSRLVQGDVGSGKTIVAAAAMLMTVKNGYQAALMAPTEILAEQHYNSLSAILDDVILLTGSMKAQAKRNACERIASGHAKIIIGTHALIQDSVEFHKLGLVVTDEQHRFGVEQRKKLEEKSSVPNVLIMSATPIPRTLAIILYGDLDISVIDEMPPGRKEVKTYAVNESYRDRINKFMLNEVRSGRQVYVVCPLVEEGDKPELNSVISLAEKLQDEVFGGYRVEFMHGKLKADIKEQIMRDFAEGSIDVLVSTTVIEVGVNVPNASLMVIENAERFGLSQLHQLRGRVGRGDEQSYCVMFVQSNNEITRERIKTMIETNDGFEIAEKDLLLRGPGDFFGTKQHGLPEMKIANLYEDRDILKQTKEAADDIIKENRADELVGSITMFNTL